MKFTIEFVNDGDVNPLIMYKRRPNKDRCIIGSTNILKLFYEAG